MKKKILLSLLVLAMLFIVTGCGKSDEKGSSNDNLHKLEFVNMRYKEPKNYSKKNPFEMEGYKMINFTYAEDENKSINIYYYKGKTYENSEDSSMNFVEKTINGVKWRVLRATDFGITYDTYDYEYGDGLYRVELNGVDKYENEFNEFMKDISFE